MSEDDLRAMLRLARMQMHDARITSFLNLVTSATIVSGVAEERILRDVFHNPYFSLSREASISTLLAAAVGRKDLTPFSGVSLEQLSRGGGPARAWLQYFNFSVDLRAVVNTVRPTPSPPWRLN
jgi:hypothetical protein